MKKRYGKLIRDRIPEIMEDAGVTFEVRTLDAEEYTAALRAKLVEEAEEAAHADRRELAKELADVMEVVQALALWEGVDLRDVEKIRRQRAAERGAFKQRLFLEWTEDG